MDEDVNGGAGMIDLPRPGVLMTFEQLRALEKYVRSDGTELEQAMLYQIEVMLTAAVAIKNMREHEEQCRQFAESQGRELSRKARLARLALSTPLGKLNKDSLKAMIEMAREQLDEVAEVENGHE